jgi:hypothetical protein
MKPWSGGNGGNCLEVLKLQDLGGNCLEVLKLQDGRIALRQSTDPDGPALVYTVSEMEAFIEAAKDGRADFLLS